MRELMEYQSNHEYAYNKHESIGFFCSTLLQFESWIGVSYRWRLQDFKVQHFMLRLGRGLVPNEPPKLIR